MCKLPLVRAQECSEIFELYPSISHCYININSASLLLEKRLIKYSSTSFDQTLLGPECWCSRTGSVPLIWSVGAGVHWWRFESVT